MTSEADSAAEIERLFMGGDQAHQQMAAEAAGESLGYVATAMSLLATVLEATHYDEYMPAFPNDIGAVACMTRTFRHLRAATNLAMQGYYGESRVLLRTAYESAGLGRLLAKDVQLAEKWLRKDRWVPDSQVRAAIEAEVNPEGEESPYRVFYKELSGWAHPSARSTLPYVVDTKGHIAVHLETTYDQTAVETLLMEIAAQAIFTCFALKRTMSAEELLPPDWRQTLAGLAEAFFGTTAPHLHRDWEAERVRYEALQAQILPADQLDDLLVTHPNSTPNVRGRAEGPDHD